MNHSDTHDDLVVKQALSIVRYRLSCSENIKLDSSRQAIEYANLKLSLEQREIFSGISMDVQQRVINYREFFTGTLSACAVYPREVVKACMEDNAGTMICLHNHPSGVLEPSLADIELTRVLKKTLQLVGVSLLDHIIVAGGSCFSMAENGVDPF